MKPPYRLPAGFDNFYPKIWEKVIAISDLHLLDPNDPAADCAALDTLLEFLDWVDRYDYLLVVLGDLIEGWHGVSYKDIVNGYYRPFFERLARMAYPPKIVIGNHDRLPMGKSIARLLKRDFGLDCRDYWVLNVGVERVLCIHADQFDSPNKKGRKVGWLVTRVTGFLERHLWKDLDLAYYRLKRNIPALQSGVNYPLECVETAKEFSSDGVLYGHTHAVCWLVHGGGLLKYRDKLEPGQTRVLNPGSWVNGNRGYMRYCDGKWTLETWGG